MSDPLYRGFFINLDRSTDRRARFEKMLQDVGAVDRYSLITGIVGAECEEQHATKLDVGNLGCFLSHLKVAEQNIHSSAHLHVTEDDAVFSPDMISVIESAIRGIETAIPDWDVLFTEVFKALELPAFVYFSRSMKEFRRTGNVGLQALKDVDFAAMSSYIINRRSIGKFRDAMHDGWKSGQPVDLHLRDVIRNGRINGYVTVPFLTTISDQADDSNIRGQADASRVIMDVLRRALFHQADYAALWNRLLETTRDARVQDVDMIYLEVLRFFFSDKYKGF